MCVRFYHDEASGGVSGCLTMQLDGCSGRIEDFQVQVVSLTEGEEQWLMSDVAF